MIEDFIQDMFVNYFIFFSMMISPFLKRNNNKDWGEIYEERCSGNIKR